MTNDKTRKLLDFDPLGEAEKLTGSSYKEDEGTGALGMLLHMEHGAEVRREMEASNDTHYNSTFAEARAVYADLGFEEVFAEHYQGYNGNTELELILWHSDGVLAHLTSYSWGDKEPGQNSSTMWMNWKYNEGEYPSGMSGSFIFDGDTNLHTWAGDRDVRTGLRYHFEDMRETGTFLSPWLRRPWMWLINYADEQSSNGNYRAINARKIAALPAHVREAINVEEI
jgi:hypothetical protein